MKIDKDSIPNDNLLQRYEEKFLNNKEKKKKQINETKSGTFNLTEMLIIATTCTLMFVGFLMIISGTMVDTPLVSNIENTAQTNIKNATPISTAQNDIALKEQEDIKFFHNLLISQITTNDNLENVAVALYSNSKKINKKIQIKNSSPQALIFNSIDGNIIYIIKKWSKNGSVMTYVEMHNLEPFPANIMREKLKSLNIDNRIYKNIYDSNKKKFKLTFT